MTKIIWMSDLHFTATGDVHGHDPRLRLAAAIDHINAHHADAEFCVLSGDLVNKEDEGTATFYAALSRQLMTLQMPVMPMVGNEDDRELLRAHLTTPQDVQDSFVQYAVPFKGGTALCLDTHKVGSDAGAYCTARLAWLREKLEQIDGPVFLFMHHHPVPLGLPMQDEIRMENAEPFLDLIADHAAIRHLFIGHVHRPIIGTIRGIPFATMRSVLYQAPPPRPAWTWETFVPAKEAPQIGVLRFADGQVQLQYDQFCDYTYGVTK